MNISIIIPVYNSEKTLPDCLSAIAGQEIAAKEVIIVDSENSDAALKIAKDFQARYYNITENSISKKRNYGARQASGEILLFLDSDCLLPTHWTKKVLEVLSEQNTIACGSHSYYLPKNSSLIAKAWSAHQQAFSRDDAAWLPTMALAVKKDIFTKLNGFNESLITCEDVDFGYRLNQYGKIYSSEKLTATHLNNPENLFQFFLKEYWRGENSFELAIKNKNRLKEKIYLLIPSYVFLILVGFLSILYFHNLVTILIFTLLMLPVLFFAIYTSTKARNYSLLPILVALYLIYILARSLNKLWFLSKIYTDKTA